MKVNVLPINTVLNPRDLGGYYGWNNRKVKSHRLLRTGSINQISIEDEHFLQDYGLCKIIDLRSRTESIECPDPKISGVEYFLIPLSDEDGTLGGKDDLNDSSVIYNEDQYVGFKMMCEHYRDHVIKKHDRAAVRQILDILANTEKGTVLYHCSEGKDRTGFVTLFILYLLGVDLETIRQDYLYSNYMLNDYRAIRDKKFQKDDKSLTFRANMRILSSASDSFFDTVLITIENKFGGIEKYFKEQLGITPTLRDRLRKLYLK